MSLANLGEGISYSPDQASSIYASSFLWPALVPNLLPCPWMTSGSAWSPWRQPLPWIRPQPNGQGHRGSGADERGTRVNTQKLVHCSSVLWTRRRKSDISFQLPEPQTWSVRATVGLNQQDSHWFGENLALTQEAGRAAPSLPVPYHPSPIKGRMQPSSTVQDKTQVQRHSEPWKNCW